jgi:aspartyl/asparaginyl beta-hydroxylase (cupin superfamily)
MNPDFSVPNEIKIRYKPADFFYNKSNLTPSLATCQELKSAPAPTDQTQIDLQNYQKQLCENRRLAEKILQIQSTQKEFQQQQQDSLDIYGHSKWRTAHLLLGMTAMACVLYI